MQATQKKGSLDHKDSHKDSPCKCTKTVYSTDYKTNTSVRKFNPIPSFFKTFTRISIEKTFVRKEYLLDKKYRKYLLNAGYL